jgi:hypothetical protein
MRFLSTGIGVRYCAGSDAPTSILSESFTISTSTDYKCRFRINGASPTTVQVKLWLSSVGEPSGWTPGSSGTDWIITNTATDSTGPQVAGWNGLGSFGTPTGAVIKSLGIGTNGDAAPTSAASGFTGTLTGQESTFSTQALTPTLSKSLSGQGSTFASQTLVSSLSKELTGQAGTFSVGTVTSTLSFSLVGQEGVFSSGTLSYSAGGGDVNIDLSGIESTFTTGNITSALGLLLNGQESTIESGMVIPDFLLTLLGEESLFSSGTLIYNISIPINGTEGEFSSGTVDIEINLALTGTEAIFSTGTITVAGEVTLTAEDIAAIVEALLSDPRMLTLPKWLALR